MGNTSSTENNGNGNGGTPSLSRPRSHGGAVASSSSQSGKSSPSWSRHGSLRRAPSQTPSSTSASTRSSVFKDNAGSQSRTRSRSGSTSNTPSTSNQRERAVSSSGTPTTSKPQASSSHLLRRPSRFGRQKSIDLQDVLGTEPMSSSSSSSTAAPPASSLAPLPSNSAPFSTQAIISPHPSPSIATDSRHVAGTTSSNYVSAGGGGSNHVSAGGGGSNHVSVGGGGSNGNGNGPSDPHNERTSAHRAFGQGIGAIFNAPAAAGSSKSTSNTMSSASSPRERETSVETSFGSAYPQTASGPPTNTGAESNEKQLHATLPSYLKIPTLIPSRQTQALPPPASSAPSSPTGLGSTTGSFGWFGGVVENNAITSTGSGAKATSAVLTTEDVVLGPGEASRVSSPSSRANSPPLGAREALSTGTVPTAADDSGAASEPPSDATSDAPSNAPSDTPAMTGSVSLSRTPTPTQKSHAAKALTPARSAASSPTLIGDDGRRIDVATGLASGTTTPVMPIPPGLTSAPPSAGTPTFARGPQSGGSSSSAFQPNPNLTIDTAAAASAKMTSPGQKTPTAVTTSEASEAANANSSTPRATRQPPAQMTPYYYRNSKAPVSLMPIVLTWRGGGRDVFVTGTFANEWRSKILLKRSAGHHHSRRSGPGDRRSGPGDRRSGSGEHSVVLHLPPGTHRMKFIVDDRWRVSRELPTATDGDGNLVNYLEIPNVGPAHGGPLSAPGEDLLDEETRDRERTRERDVERIKEASRRRPGSSQTVRAPDDIEAASASAKAAVLSGAIPPSEQADQGAITGDAHRRAAVLDLREEARKAELLKRGQLDDVFGVDEEALRAAENWVQEVPESVLRAQLAEETYRDQVEGADTREQDEMQPPAIPPPPSLPRQLEKVILNSSPANPALAPPGGLVDDNSILPAPNHVVLNHLTASAIKGGVLAVGTTTRYKRKYVTTVFYRPVNAA